MGQKQLCQTAGQGGKGSFKPRMTREEDYNLQLSQEVVDPFGKEMVQGNV